MDSHTILDQTMQTWNQPEELKGSRPREVCLTGKGKLMAGAAFLMFLIGLAVGIGFYAKFSRDQEEQKRIAQYGMTAEAVIKRRWISQTSKLPYHIEYAYQVEGKTYRGERSIGSKFWRNFEKKESISVRYLSSNPAKHSVPGYDPELMQPWLAFLFASGFFLWAGAVARVIVLQYQALAEGVCAPAVVERISLHNNLWQRVAHFAFIDRNGVLFNGKLEPQVSPPSKGAIINIVYRLDHENRNSIYSAPFIRLKNIR